MFFKLISENMSTAKQNNILVLIIAIVGFLLLLYPITFILGFVLSLIVFVWSILNFRKAKRNKKSTKFPLVAIVISSLSTVFAILWIVKIMLVWSSFSKAINPEYIPEAKDTLAVDIDYYQKTTNTY